ncbi:hypothetical protein BpHYR1_034176 [Brachionus plicatilis]|uniref:Uncharacterized protein n=1 Tax=Brachionus plicatilis TaxID=10195 RepID=A0A3M7QKA7_BRAPC|nr:hypothetical protein BpHYR1_034176 [Brachionus plicatilis]
MSKSVAATADSMASFKNEKILVVMVKEVVCGRNARDSCADNGALVASCYVSSLDILNFVDNDSSQAKSFCLFDSDKINE